MSKKSFTNSEGWTFNYHDRELDLFTIPNRTILKEESYWIYECSIASSPGVTRQVFFVDYLDNGAWITMYQCRNEVEAQDVLQDLKRGKTPTYRGEK